MTPIKLKSELEQSAAKLREMRANLASEKTDVLSSCDKLQASSRRGKLKPGETAYLGKRVDGLKKQYQDVLAQQDKHIELQNAAIRHELEMMHGLLAYGLANSGLGAEARVLHASLDDFLNAKTEADRNAAERSVNLCLKHGSLTKVGKPDTAILDEYEALEGEDATAFYKKHEKTIHSQLQARQDAANQS
jgi:hypothetical protein